MCRSTVDSSPWFLNRFWYKSHRPLRWRRRQDSSGQARAPPRGEPAKSAHEQITIEVKVTVSYPLQKISALHKPVLPPLCIRTFLAPIPSPRFAYGAISQHESATTSKNPSEGSTQLCRGSPTQARISSTTQSDGKKRRGVFVSRSHYRTP